MSFADDIRRWTLKVQTKSRDVFVGTVMAVHESIVEGSPITGAPGQPVDSSFLKGSWLVDIQGDMGKVTTKTVYAESNEDGIARPGGGPYVQRSAVGGRWSVALTRMNFGRLVDDVVAWLGDNPPPAGFQDNSVLGGSGS
jgi:hypothetical protein